MTFVYVKLRRTVVFCLLFSVLGVAPTIGADPAADLIDKGTAASQQGRFEAAAAAWEAARGRIDPVGSPGRYIDLAVHLAGAYQASGFHRKGLQVLMETEPILAKIDDSRRTAQFHSVLGDLYLSLGEKARASEHATTAIKAARKADDPKILAAVLTNAGNLFASDRDWEGAMATYAEAAEHADAASDAPSLKARALLNAFHAAVQSGRFEGSDPAYLLDILTSLPDTHAKGRDLVRAGLIFQELADGSASGADGIDPDVLRQLAFSALKDALALAQSLEDHRTASHAAGQLGALYESLGRREDALTLTRKARFFAQSASSPDLLYLWQWQTGRLLAAMGDIDGAVRAYQDAIAALAPIRVELFSGFRGHRDVFNKEVKPVYLGLADLYLRQAGQLAGEPREKKLKAARDVMESLKAAELQDYFADECATLMAAKSRTLDRAPEGTAILYPIVLEDRLALLLTLSDGIRHMDVPVSSDTLKETVTRFRKRLQNRMNNRFLYEARQLYDWLIRPIQDRLDAHDVHTIVFAPDGVLRLFPLSTLHDGSRFLVEQYALALIPAAALTDPRPFPKENVQILLSGLSESRQEFSPLPSVPKELQDIRQIMNGKTVLLDKEFTVDNLTAAFRRADYTICHLATHGVFGGTPDESFLLSYNTRFNMNGLERLIAISRFRDKPVEMLTLSACQTALGNERAALGLAGVAVKAGVRSAVATLWYVDDEATSLAIREFYRQLKKPGVSKAMALQNAQRSLIQQPRYWQPLYWAPFLLIGNWM